AALRALAARGFAVLAARGFAVLTARRLGELGPAGLAAFGAHRLAPLGACGLAAPAESNRFTASGRSALAAAEARLEALVTARFPRRLGRLRQAPLLAPLNARRLR